jgi:hypothetical protein
VEITLGGRKNTEMLEKLSSRKRAYARTIQRTPTRANAPTARAHLLEATDAGEARQRAAELVAVEGAEVGVAHRQLAVGPEAVLEHQAVACRKRDAGRETREARCEMRDARREMRGARVIGGERWAMPKPHRGSSCRISTPCSQYSAGIINATSIYSRHLTVHIDSTPTPHRNGIPNRACWFGTHNNNKKNNNNNNNNTVPHTLIQHQRHHHHQQQQQQR